MAIFRALHHHRQIGWRFRGRPELWYLDLVFDFQPGAVNSAAALDGLLYTYTLGFALPMFVAYIAMIKYPLTKQKHEEIVES